MPRVRILYVIGTLEIGGAERQLAEMAVALDRSRFDPVVCCLSSAGPLEQTLRSAGIPVHVAGYVGFRGFRGILKRVAGLARFVRIVHSQQPVIVHAFLFWACVIAAFAARLVRIPVVVSSRRVLGTFTDRKPHYRLLERAANTLTDLVIANSEAVRRDAIACEQLAADKIIVIHNGLDLSRFESAADVRPPDTLDVPDGAPVVVVVANFHAYKGHETFLAAWAEVVRHAPDAIALLVGEGPARAACEERSRELGIDQRTRFLGSRRDVPAILSRADVLVHPSTQEGFSNAILEAMAAGKPVIATDVGGNPEAVVAGETGLLVPVGDAWSLSHAMLSMLRHPDEARRLGRAGRRRVEALFTVAGAVRQYEEVYERLLAESATRRGRWHA